MKRAWSAVVVVGHLAVTSVATAEPPPEDCPDVGLDIAGPTMDRETVATVLRGVVRPTEVQVVPRADIGIDTMLLPPEDPPCLRSVVDLDRDGQALLVVIDDRRQRYLVRRYERAADDIDVLAERIAQTIGSAVRAVAAGETFGTSSGDALRALQGPAPPPSPAPPSPSPAPPPADEATRAGDAVDVEAFIGYELALIADGPDLGHGPRLGVLVDFLGPALNLGVRFDVGYQVGAPLDAPEAPLPPLDGRIDSIPVRTGVFVGTETVPVRVHGWLGGGLAIDLPFLDVAPFYAELAEPSLVPLVAIGSRIELALDEDAGVYLDLSADVLPLQPRYAVETLEAEVVRVWSPWRVQPRMSLGVRVF